MLIYDTEGKLIYDYTAYKDNKGGYEPDVITNEAYDGKSDNRLPEESDLQDKAAGKLGCLVGHVPYRCVLVVIVQYHIVGCSDYGVPARFPVDIGCWLQNLGFFVPAVE